MMLLARGLAGVQVGATTTLAYAYLGVSFEKFTENKRMSGKFDEKKLKRAKGYLFNSYGAGSMLGYVLGLGE